MISAPDAKRLEGAVDPRLFEVEKGVADGHAWLLVAKSDAVGEVLKDLGDKDQHLSNRRPGAGVGWQTGKTKIRQCVLVRVCACVIVSVCMCACVVGVSVCMCACVVRVSVSVVCLVR